MSVKVIGYARVSTEEQATDGVSLEIQVEKIKAYCALYDLELVEVIVDAGVSAKTLDRPGVQSALARLRTGEVQGLVIAKLDRLSRNVADFAHLIDEFFADHVKTPRSLFSVGDSIDTRTAAGRLVLNVLMSVAQWEREVISERTTSALSHKKAKGECYGTVPFGYRLADSTRDPQSGKLLNPALVADSNEQATIARINALRDAGTTYKAIADSLNKSGITTKEGGKWLITSVVRVLQKMAVA